MNRPSIQTLLAQAKSDDCAIYGSALRLIKERWDECESHLEELIEIWCLPDAARRRTVELTIAKLENTGKPLIEVFYGLSGNDRDDMLGFIVGIVPFEQSLPLLKHEIELRPFLPSNWALHCLVRIYDPEVLWPDEAMVLLARAVSQLLQWDEDPEITDPQVRLTLKAYQQKMG